MDERGLIPNNVFDERHIVEVQEPTVNSDSEVVLVLLENKILRITGPSGREYLFSGAGASLPVNREDANKFLSIKRQSCCTGLTGALFQEI